MPMIQTKRCNTSWSGSRGFSLIELMVSLVIGLILILGATNLMTSTFSTYGFQQRRSAVDTELRTLMTGIERDIRRIGFHEPNSAGLQQSLTLSEQMGNTIVISNNPSYIAFSYFLNPDPVNPLATRIAYRHDAASNTLQSCTGLGNNVCQSNNNTGWFSLTSNVVGDNNRVQITNATFTQNNRGTTSTPLYEVSIPTITVTLTARHVNDPAGETRTLTERIKLRNPEINSVP